MVPLLRDWVITLAMTSLIAGIAEAMTPQGSTRKYVRVALGMIIVSLVLEPIVDIVQRVRGEAEAPPFGATVPAFSAQDSPDVFAERVKWQVETMAMSIEGVRAVASSVSTSPESDVMTLDRLDVRIWLEPEKALNGNAIAEALRALLAAYLGIRTEDISVSIAG